MATNRERGKELLELDRLIEEIIVDAYGDDEQLWAFRRVLKAGLSHFSGLRFFGFQQFEIEQSHFLNNIP
jgi:hypothetical protein